MGRTAGTEPQFLYKGALYLFTIIVFGGNIANEGKWCEMCDNTRWEDWAETYDGKHTNTI